MNEKHLDRYAELLVVHGAGLRRGQPLFIHAEPANRDLALRVGEAAYDHGASEVDYWLNDPLEVSQIIRRARPEIIETCRESERQWYNQITRRRAAIISLRGDEYPSLLDDLAVSHPERHALYSRASNEVGRPFHAHGINRNLCPWVVAGAPTAAWGKLVFPELDEKEATERLAELIFRFTHADRDDALEHAAAKDRLLHARRAELNALEIREIHVEGKDENGKAGSDFVVGLSPQARWLGGSKTTASGQRFNANVPSEENFTTPDCRHTEGRFVATMPFRTKSGVLVEGLVMRFENGKVVDFEAQKGADGFERWLDTDRGARYLGEIALVGEDSPIAQSGRFFEHTLFDENASAHAALGKSYATALDGGPGMSAKQLAALGANTSLIHTDIMFGAKNVTITATQSREGEVVLIDGGRWTERFLTADRQPVES